MQILFTPQELFSCNAITLWMAIQQQYDMSGYCTYYAITIRRFFFFKSPNWPFLSFFKWHGVLFIHRSISRPAKILNCMQCFFHFWGKGVGALWRGKNAIGGGILFVYLFYIVFFAVEKGSNSCNTSLKYVSFS
jgi:hypothetical protein